MVFCNFFKLPGGQYGMSPLLLLIFSLVLLGLYLLWTICYFFAKRKILNTSQVIIYFTVAFLAVTIFAAIGDIFDIINLIFVLSVIISSVTIYILNKINFNKLIS